MFASPIGPLRFVASERGVTRVCFEGEQLLIDEPSDHPVATQELTEYFAGTRREFSVPLDLQNVTEFRAAVLRELEKVPYGETTSYAELARAVGNPNAVRAVGSACATNPLPLFIPCHRVLRSDGQLGGYRGGVEAKRFLLRIEGIDV
ncbi:Methylated-DNA--protein-cysteine methyltransferase, constitutive [Corynebacterium afermentans subsp. afermentans]|uniref:Methylated-DNA--protein-cysteine methyltransferase n=1 Tax=Corynebacterium afermentans TaxID=38286 RepID=A0A9X8WJI3_9CORY|nr:methylated-DNA--[protein]-cysteine S-methyltransferase [Corynebacterium afermentans]OAA17219.1 cysteine methyltransferase [Corynebacterium afermentans subsp. afermentans]WJY57376.1 Methylated-DNA--protein-cysteine methyltransferase, constitutive [Corynebacterium afermentans subsp. afermentans]SIQ76436.1 methylated-DNA-[protein]-cysteine S-methyltransferase [Corynebacterium afermentans]